MPQQPVQRAAAPQPVVQPMGTPAMHVAPQPVVTPVTPIQPTVTPIGTATEQVARPAAGMTLNRPTEIRSTVEPKSLKIPDFLQRK